MAKGMMEGNPNPLERDRTVGKDGVGPDREGSLFWGMIFLYSDPSIQAEIAPSQFQKLIAPEAGPEMSSLHSEQDPAGS